MTQIKTSISIDSELLKSARELKINISRACSNGLRSEVYDYQQYQKDKQKKEIQKVKREIKKQEKQKEKK